VSVVLAYEFETAVIDGTIRIPENISGEVDPWIKVMLFPAKNPTMQKSDLFPDMRLDTRGHKFDRDEANER
jgi:hypothetical protein